jgi:SPP1 family predicted phage head-tail adaptor
MTTRSGEYDREITILQNTPTRNSIGEVRPAWSDFRTLPARVIPLMSRDRFMSGGEHNVRAATFRTRWFDGLKSTMQIQYEGSTYEIKGIAEVGRREGLDISAEVIK